MLLYTVTALLCATMMKCVFPTWLSVLRLRPSPLPVPPGRTLLFTPQLHCRRKHSTGVIVRKRWRGRGGHLRVALPHVCIVLIHLLLSLCPSESIYSSEAGPTTGWKCAGPVVCDWTAARCRCWAGGAEQLGSAGGAVSTKPATVLTGSWCWDLELPDYPVIVRWQNG